uniref:E-selectin-like n=1 Tax=Myxine glutinosa TaxID=7769 RepID=UPI00358ED5CB
MMSLQYRCSLLLIITTISQVSSWTYFHSENKFPWRGARNYCRKRNASMVAIANQKENDHLDESLPYSKGYYWTSGVHNGSGWIWTSSQEVMHFTNWAKGEPNNLTTRENCVEIYIKSETSPGQWNDDKCRKWKRALCYEASCSNSTCLGHGICLETIGNYTCRCDDGFTGARCENDERVMTRLAGSTVAMTTSPSVTLTTNGAPIQDEIDSETTTLEELLTDQYSTDFNTDANTDTLSTMSPNTMSPAMNTWRTRTTKAPQESSTIGEKMVEATTLTCGGLLSIAALATYLQRRRKSGSCDLERLRKSSIVATKENEETSSMSIQIGPDNV